MSRYIFLFGLMVFTILAFSLYRAKYSAGETIRQIAEVEDKIKAAEALHTTLLVEFSHRSRQEWLEQYARRDLGMLPARAEQFIRFKDLDDQVGPAAPDKYGDKETGNAR